jgi:DNA ligase D-like protein (predicted polymerase)
MVMKRYPNGASGDFFFMKRAPSPRPDWIEICSITHGSGNIIDFPMVQDLASLLWVINLGCIDLNQWYARCDDVDRPDYLHFDLDPVKGAPFERVIEVALIVHDALDHLGMPSYVKTTGSKGLHVYVPIVRGPTQKEVWAFAKALAQSLDALHPALITSEYRVAKRPTGRVLVDYNQNAWGRTLASVYSVRPQPRALVSTPVTMRSGARRSSRCSRTSTSVTFPRECASAVTCGRPCSPARSGCASRPCPDPRGRRGGGDPDRHLGLALSAVARGLVSRGPSPAARARVLRTALPDRGDQRILLLAPAPRALRGVVRDAAGLSSP